MIARPTLLIAPGGPDRRTSATVNRIAQQASATATFLGTDGPKPLTVLQQLKQSGQHAVSIVPLMLTTAYHFRVDVAHIAAHTRDQLGMDVHQRAHVGGSHLLPALLRDLPACDAIVLASAGSNDISAVTSVDAIARQISTTIDAPCEAAFAANVPYRSVPGVIRRLRSRGARRIAMVSYFIAPGVLHDRVCQQAKESQITHIGPTIGESPELVNAIRTWARAA